MIDCPRNRFISWLKKEQPRVCHEWNKWDGTLEHGVLINDAQCARIDDAKSKLGTPFGLGSCGHDCECVKHFVESF